MKQVWQRLMAKEETGERLQMLSTGLMILLFIMFWGASFYVLLNSFG